MLVGLGIMLVDSLVVLLMFLAMVLISLFPGIALWLPGQMMG